MLTSTLIRLRALLSRRAADADLDDELRYHLDRETDRNIANGMSPAAARDAARRAFGNATAHADAAREAMRWGWVEQLMQDARYGARALRSTPAFTLTAVVSLALGVGANVAMFSAADSLLMRRLPVPSPEQLASTHGGSYSIYRDLSALSVFSHVGAEAIVDRTIDGTLARVALVSGNYFNLFGVRAASGRTLSPQDDKILDGHPVVVISDAYRRSHFGATGDVVGRTVTIHATRFTVLGVAATGFGGDVVGRPADVWVPMMMQTEVMPEWPNLIQRDNGFLRILFRMKPGISAAQAQTAIQPAYQANQILRAGNNATPEFRRNLASDPLIVVSIQHGYTHDREQATQSFGVLLIIALLVLLIAATNVASLFLVRGAARGREMAVRAALGAGRARLARQVLVEAVMLSLLGGAVGLLFADWTTSALSITASLGPVQLDARAPSSVQSFDIRPGIGLYLLAAIVSVAIGFFFGIVPALRAAATDVSSGMMGRRAAIGGTGRRRLGTAPVVAQIALSIVLLVGTGLFVRSLHNLRSRELGIDRSHLLLVWTVPGQTGRTTPQYVAYTEQLLARLRATPGVAAASVTNHGLLEGGDVGGDSNLLTIDGQPAPGGMQVLRDAVGSGFFAAAGMTILAGRDLRPSDDTASPRVALVNQTMARHFFGSASPIGHRLGTPRDPLEIIGVVADTRHGSPRDSRGVWYVTYRQFPGLLRSVCIVVRTQGNPAALRVAVQQALRAFDPALPVLRMDTVNEQLDDVLVQERALAGISMAFAILAGLLACVGLYGVLAYAVARRANEIGVRAALGATASDILTMVLRDSSRIVVIGVAFGIPAALAVARFTRARLYGVGAADPLIVTVASALMMCVALIAGWLPARRAAKTDPAVALRLE